MELYPADFAERLVSGMSDAIVLYADAEGVIRLWNRGAPASSVLRRQKHSVVRLTLPFPKTCVSGIGRGTAARCAPGSRATETADPVCAGRAEERQEDLCRVHHCAVHRQCRPHDRHCRNRARRHDTV